MATFEADPAVLAEPPITQSEIVTAYGADGRVCRGTVLRTYSSPQYVVMEGHEDDNHYERVLLDEQVLAFPICVEEVDREKWKAIRAETTNKGVAVRFNADHARSVAATARDSALNAIAKSAGLSADQVEALFGRSAPAKTNNGKGEAAKAKVAARKG